MRVLVSTASRHGATAEIGEAIGRRLRDAGLDVAVQAPQEITTLEGFDSVILGSAVYAGHWLEPARDFVKRHRGHLATIPVWAFSSGPIGNPPLPAEHAVDIAAIVAAVHPLEHQLFAGKLDRKKLGFMERALTAALRAPEGDFRDWPAIEAWADGIARAITSRAPQSRV